MSMASELTDNGRVSPSSNPVSTAPRLAAQRRGLWIGAAWASALVAVLAVLPLVAEISSAFTGQHLWTWETVWYAVIPIAAIVAALLLALSVRTARSFQSAITRTVLSIIIVLGGCLPLFILFVTLVNLTFRPAP
jgi:hypothetical protein